MIKPGPMGPVFDMFDVGEFRATGKSTSSPRGRNTSQADAIAKILLVIWGKVWYTAP